MELIIRKASFSCKKGVGTVKSECMPERPQESEEGSTENTSETDPAEMIASAHVRSFALALSQEVGQKAFAAGETVITTAVSLQHLAAGWTVMDIHLTVSAMLPNVTQGEFVDATVRAKTNCMVSRLLRPTLSMNAKLEKERAAKPGSMY
jgi:osmotically inducible protein OsmC